MYTAPTGIFVQLLRLTVPPTLEVLFSPNSTHTALSANTTDNNKPSQSITSPPATFKNQRVNYCTIPAVIIEEDSVPRRRMPLLAKYDYYI